MLFLTLSGDSKKFSYNMVICNSKNTPIRKIGKFFYSKIFGRFVLYVDLILLYLLVKKGIRVDQFFFFVFASFTNFSGGMNGYRFSSLLNLL